MDEYQILDYFKDSYQEYWRSQILRLEWDGAEELVAMLEKNEFAAKVGENAGLFIMADGESLISLCIVNDVNNVFEGPERGMAGEMPVVIAASGSYEYSDVVEVWQRELERME